MPPTVSGASRSHSTRSAERSSSGGDKSGGSEKRFYRQLIDKADDRFDGHLAVIKKQKQKEKERK
jgi:hypothetical protein